MGKQKFYVVWKGRETGIFETWDDCNKQVLGYHNAVYKSFKTKESGELAFNGPSKDFIGILNSEDEIELTDEQKKLIGEPILESISVDGSWNTRTGVVEYQGVNTMTKTVLFRMGPLDDGTNNIVEFLAIVHGLAYSKQNNLTLPIYSDSRTAISWVKKKDARTIHPRSDKNKKLFELIDRAIKWLKENEYPNQVLKWETPAWGENPADYGRK